MTDAVDRTLRHWRLTPFKWGTSDCVTSLADHALSITGIDPIPEWRGTYDTDVEAEEAIAGAGGLVALLDGCAAVSRCEVPQRGDVVAIWTGCEELLGLCTGQSAAFRLERGVKEIDLRFLTVVGSWKV